MLEETDANLLKNAIDKKIYFLHMHPPEIEVLKWHKRIIRFSELSNIFDHDELHEAIERH